jgi:putative component of membrane protein insertase Oxa1/YidC/SpoIIIJ protein YidD
MKSALLALIRVSIFVAPAARQPCRFYPSCSDYAREAITARRRSLRLACPPTVGRCHPYHPGGYDPMP